MRPKCETKSLICKSECENHFRYQHHCREHRRCFLRPISAVRRDRCCGSDEVCDIAKIAPILGQLRLSREGRVPLKQVVCFRDACCAANWTPHLMFDVNDRLENISHPRPTLLNCG